MEVLSPNQTKWEEQLREIGAVFAERAAQSDLNGTFVFENYELLKQHRFFSAMIPEAFGGGGLSHEEMCRLIKMMARYCGSTALAFSMHQHLIAATVWKHKHQGDGAAVLQKVADQQLVLVSTGARDWLGSNGELKKVKGGYLFSGRKHFASQSAGGDIAVTSAPYRDPENNWKVLHFAVPIQSDGVQILDDWDVMGMRATGSSTLVFENVFVPDAAVSLEREKGVFHPAWDVVLAVAMPLIMAAYVGIAEKAVEIAQAIGQKYYRNQEHMPSLIGQLHNSLLGARVQWEAIYRLTNNFDFKPDRQATVHILSYKTNVATACMDTVALAMEAIGGQSFYRKNELERLFRDVQAAQFHPLPKWEQYAFTGEYFLSQGSL